MMSRWASYGAAGCPPRCQTHECCSGTSGDEGEVEKLEVSSRIWRRYLEDSVPVIQVQASRHNAGPDGEFWLNAGVYFPAIARRWPVFPVTESPVESDCHLRHRPMAPVRNRWEVRAAGVAKPNPESGRILGTIFSWLDRRADRRAPETNARVTRELAETLDRYALPWLKKMADLRAARHEWHKNGPLDWAAAASQEGDKAIYLFQLAVAQAKAGTDELLEWGRANGLVP